MDTEKNNANSASEVVCPEGNNVVGDSKTDGLPDFVNLAKSLKNPPALPSELIEGILLCGHKMLISGASKTGKSFLLMELCIAIAEGLSWLGFSCKKGRVLYINLEIDESSAIKRFSDNYEALGIQCRHAGDIDFWNLRGNAMKLDQLVPEIISRARDQHYDAIIIDPIYKVITGDENNATEMSHFCNQFDKLCADLGCAAIYCHHHSKGAQGAKRAIDRPSGSEVYARDPDALLDLVELTLSNDMKTAFGSDDATAFRLEASLREFPRIKPRNLWYKYPIHRIDDSGILDDAYAEGSPVANFSKSPKYTTPNQRKASVNAAYAACRTDNQPVTVAAMAAHMGVSERCVRDRLKECGGEFNVRNGFVFKS